MNTEVAEVLKDRELLGRVAVHCPHVAGTMLRLLNDLEDAARLGELPPAPLLAELGAYVEGVGKLVAALASSEDSGRLGLVASQHPRIEPGAVARPRRWSGRRNRGGQRW